MILNTPKRVKAHTRNWLLFCIRGLHTLIQISFLQEWPIEGTKNGISLLSIQSKTELHNLFVQLENTIQALENEYPKKRGNKNAFE